MEGRSNIIDLNHARRKYMLMAVLHRIRRSIINIYRPVRNADEKKSRRKKKAR